MDPLIHNIILLESDTNNTNIKPIRIDIYKYLRYDIISILLKYFDILEKYSVFKTINNTNMYIFNSLYGYDYICNSINEEFIIPQGYYHNGKFNYKIEIGIKSALVDIVKYNFTIVVKSNSVNVKNNKLKLSRTIDTTIINFDDPDWYLIDSQRYRGVIDIVELTSDVPIDKIYIKQNIKILNIKNFTGMIVIILNTNFGSDIKIKLKDYYLNTKEKHEEFIKQFLGRDLTM